jgi:DNA polymerase III subunit epsilon
LYFFFDTETTGLNKSSDRVIQVAWLLISEDGKELRRSNRLIKPSGFEIPPAAEKIHGISTAVANRFGVPLRQALLEFARDIDVCKVIIGHNLSFDIDMLRPEFARENIEFRLDGKSMVCTMRSSTAWCRLPKLDGRPGYKWPKLDELHYRLFGNYFDNAHDALNDVLATKACFFELIRINVIPNPLGASFQESSVKLDRAKLKTVDKPISSSQKRPEKFKFSSSKNEPISQTTTLNKPPSLQSGDEDRLLKNGFRTVASCKLCCDKCGEKFSVTLRRYENAAACPRCFSPVTTSLSW